MASSFFASMEVYHPQRWHKRTPSLLEWSALALCHNAGAISLEASGQLQEASLSLVDIDCGF